MIKESKKLKEDQKPSEDEDMLLRCLCIYRREMIPNSKRKEKKRKSKNPFFPETDTRKF